MEKLGKNILQFNISKLKLKFITVKRGRGGMNTALSPRARRNQWRLKCHR